MFESLLVPDYLQIYLRSVGRSFCAVAVALLQRRRSSFLIQLWPKKLFLIEIDDFPSFERLERIRITSGRNKGVVLNTTLQIIYYAVKI